jgi:hypothetical protein
MALLLLSYTVVVIISAVSSTYIVTCHNNNECGTVCGYYQNDIVAPTEGLFGTSCTCQSGKTTHRCYYGKYDVQVCSDYKPPNCKASCGQKICITKDNKKTTATILSACPRNHPDNTAACCQYQNDAYCTCIIQDTLDLDAAPYSALGGTNGYSSSAVWGSCYSVLESLQININSTRAENLVQPFLRNGEWCPTKEKEYRENFQQDCAKLDETQCSANSACTYCHTAQKGLPTERCYNKAEAEVLAHVSAVESGAGSFTCTRTENSAIAASSPAIACSTCQPTLDACLAKCNQGYGLQSDNMDCTTPCYTDYLLCNMQCDAQRH